MEEKSYYIYVISDGVRYVGMTENPEKRLREHNSGKSKFTSGHMPWKLIYQEFGGNQTQTRKLEKYYKSAAGRRKVSKLFPKG